MFRIPTRRALPLLLVLAIALPAFERKHEEDDDDFDMPLERWHYLYDQRQSSATEFPEGARLRAFRALDRMERARASAKTNARRPEFSGAWKPIGPQPIQYTSSYATSGRVTALAVDPRNADTVYIGGADGGVWKTTDGGNTWTPVTDDQPSLAIGSLALDPTNPDIVYAGTGEENFSIDAYSGVGIFRSENAGATWTNLVGPFARQRVGAIAVSPGDGKILLAASNCQTTDGCAAAGIYRSADSGQSWTLVLPGTGTSVYFEPNQPSVAWAGLGAVRGATSNGVYRSTDAGQSWRRITGVNGAALPTGTSIGRIEVVAAGITVDTAYAAIANAIGGSGATLNGLYKTTDAGQHWTKLAAPDFCAPQCWYDLTVRQQPNDPNTIFAGGVQLYRSSNGGLSWVTISGSTAPHVDHHALQYSADGARFYDGNDGGVWSSDNFTSPSTFTIRWNNLNSSLSLTQYYSSLSIHPTDPRISFAGSQDNGTHLYQGDLAWTRVISGDGGWTAIDPASPNVVYAEYVDVSLFKTNNGTFLGDTLDVDQGIEMEDRVPFIASFVIDPQNPQRLYYGTYRLYRTTDGAGLWRPISGDLTNAPDPSTTSSTYTISAIAVAPTDANTIYTGARSGAVYATSDGGANWRLVSSNLPSRGVGHITVDPIDPATVYVGYSGFSSISETVGGHVFRSSDRGNSWTDITSNLPNVPVNDLVVDPDVPNTIYIGTDLGALVSSDAGGTWDTLGSGMPRTAVMSLVLHRPSRTLRAATHGRGAYDYALGGGSGLGPSITSLSPATANAGGASFALTITGTNFTSSSHVRWNGEERAVSAATATTITLTIPASDIATVGRAAVTVLNLASGGGASAAANFVIGPAPILQNNSAVNAANPLGATASPGSIISLYGANFTGAVSQAVDFPLPETLGGLIVTVAGRPAPLYFVSPGQINLQVPYETSQTSPASITVKQGALTSNPISLNMARVSPGLFSTNQQGSGQGAILVANSSALAAPNGAFSDSHPVKAGDTIEIFCTGLGSVTGNVTTGDDAPASPPATTILQPSVTIGGKSALVSFSGLAPGFAGLYQVNVQVPAGLVAGDAVAVVLTIGTVQSNAVTIAVE